MKSLSKVMKAFQVSVGNTFTIKNMEEEKQEVVEEKEEPSAEEIAQKILEDARSEAQLIIENAKNQAKIVMTEASQQAEEIKMSVFKQAREDGYQSGHQESIQKAESLIREAEQIKANAQKKYQSVLENAEKEIVRMALVIAKKVIGDEIASRTEAVQALVAQTLQKCKSAETVTVKVSPQDYDAVQQNIDRIIQKSTYSGNIYVTKDLALTRGSCIVETPIGNIDSSIPTQLKSIEEALEELLESI